MPGERFAHGARTQWAQYAAIRRSRLFCTGEYLSSEVSSRSGADFVLCLRGDIGDAEEAACRFRHTLGGLTIALSIGFAGPNRDPNSLPGAQPFSIRGR